MNVNAGITIWKHPSAVSICKRCGVERSRGGNSAALCGDCRLASHTELRAAIFDDTDLSVHLKLFALATVHIVETADEYRRLKKFKRSPWAYRALRFMGYSGTDEELSLTLKGVIRPDVPKYRHDFHSSVPCVGVMLRPAGVPCKKRPTIQSWLPNPMTGERHGAGACANPNHRIEYERQRQRAWEGWRENGKPEPKPNTGGLLLRYFTSGIEPLYAWTDREYKTGDAVPAVPDKPLAPVIAFPKMKGTHQ